MAAAVACATLAAQGASAATRPITIKRSDRILPFTKFARVSGRLASRADGVEIQLLADRWPFESFATAATATTHDGGRYGFRVKQPVGTRYRARLADQPAMQSRTVTVYRRLVGRLVRCNYCSRPNPAAGTVYTLRVTYALRSARGSRYRPGRQYFYFGLRKDTRRPRILRRAKRARIHRVRPHRYRQVIRHRFRVPRGRYTFEFTACERDHFGRDGLGLPGHHHCGDRRVRSSVRYLG
jgi:hypothetical protein